MPSHLPSDRYSSVAKPRLLVVELWGLGDLIIATPFLRAAAEKYAVTVLAKPYGKDLQARFWPGVEVIPFIAPWTAFQHKYQLRTWPWREIFRLRKILVRNRFEVGLSARSTSDRLQGDPRDHLLLALFRAKIRIGFPHRGSRIFLTQSLESPDPREHRYENWRLLGDALRLDMPDRDKIPLPSRPAGGEILVHSGAGQPVRVWPLERYRTLVGRLREKKYRVQVACDPDQREWWLRAGETSVATPHTVTELLAVTDRAGVFIGNDSGPGHLAAFCGVPTFTLFGPQLPEWFSPLHPAAAWLEGKACPYKPCFDYCRFATPVCLAGISEEEACAQAEAFVGRHARIT